MTIKLRFFFDWGIGCLWAGDSETASMLGFGPLDLPIRWLDGARDQPPSIALSEQARRLRDHLADESREQLNPTYPPAPSFWRQARCDKFNADVDRLLAMIRAELGPDYEVLDVQDRYQEDPQLDEYLRTDRWANEYMKTGRTRLPHSGDDQQSAK